MLFCVFSFPMKRRKEEHTLGITKRVGARATHKQYKDEDLPIPRNPPYIGRPLPLSITPFAFSCWRRGTAPRWMRSNALPYSKTSTEEKRLIRQPSAATFSHRRRHICNPARSRLLLAHLPSTIPPPAPRPVGVGALDDPQNAKTPIALSGGCCAILLPVGDTDGRPYKGSERKNPQRKACNQQSETGRRGRRPLQTI